MWNVFLAPLLAYLLPCRTLSIDETLPGSWEWDLKRLVASAVIACEELGGSESDSELVVRKIISSYREKLTEYASLSYVNLAYEFLGERVVRDNFSKSHLLKDYVRKVVGIGSVGTICGVMYFEGASLEDPLFLQYKQAQESVLSPYIGSSIYKNQAHRVVAGQRLLQGAPDIFLGYVASSAKYYYVRQLRDMKGGLTFGDDGCNLEAFEDYAKMFGWALALGHARSGDAAKIAGYLGKSYAIDDALYRFSTTYAKQNLQDYELFCQAIESGKLHDS